MLLLLGVVLVATLYFLRACLSKFSVRKLPTRYVFITGCDTGFGNLLARTLDSMGVPVFAGCLTEKGKNKLINVCSSNLQALLVDVTKQDSVEEAVQIVKKCLPDGAGLWGLVNNAGLMGYSGPFEWLTEDNLNQVLNVNLHGTMRVTRAFLPLVRKARGRIVNMSSSTVFCPSGGMTSYTVSKLAIEAFSDCLRRELYNFGVSVHVMQPGLFNTCIFSEDKLAAEKVFLTKCNPEPEVREAYSGSIVQFIVSCLEQFSGTGDTDLMKVINAQKHALFSVRPKNRYIVGTDAVVFWLFSRLPDILLDAIVGWPSPGPVKQQPLNYIMSYIFQTKKKSKLLNNTSVF